MKENWSSEDISGRETYVGERLRNLQSRRCAPEIPTSSRGCHPNTFSPVSAVATTVPLPPLGPRAREVTQDSTLTQGQKCQPKTVHLDRPCYTELVELSDPPKTGSDRDPVTLLSRVKREFSDRGTSVLSVCDPQPCLVLCVKTSGSATEAARGDTTPFPRTDPGIRLAPRDTCPETGRRETAPKL